MARARRPRRAGSARAVRSSGDVPLLGPSSAGGTTRVEAPVGGDAVQPGADRGTFLEPSEALPGGQHRLLQGVLGVLEGSEHPVAVHLELPTVRLGQLSERVAVACPRPGQQLGCHHCTIASCLSVSMSTSVSTPVEPRNGRRKRAQFLDVVVSASSRHTFTP